MPECTWKEQVEFTKNFSLLIQYINAKGFQCAFTDGCVFGDAMHGTKSIWLKLYSPDGTLLEESKDFEPFGVYWENLNELNRWGGRFPREICNQFETYSKSDL